jgi:hypothetical protein
MMRRVRCLVLALILFAPVIASAGAPDSDPDGLVATSPAMVDWIDSIVQVLVIYIGI